MFTKEKVSAGYLRGLGATIPAKIPDCATATIAKITPVYEPAESKGFLNFRFEIDLAGPFEWIEVKATIEKGKEA